MRGWTVCVLVGLGCAWPAAPVLAAGEPAAPAALYAELEALEPDPAAALAVGEMVLARGPARLSLGKGTVFPLRAGGRWVGAVYQGDGRLGFTPAAGPGASPIEADQLEKFTGKRLLDEPFTRALFLFTDATGAELEAGSSAKVPAPAEAAARFLGERIEHHAGKLGRNLRARLLAGLVDGDASFFLAEVDTRGLGTVSFLHDGRALETEWLGRYHERYGGVLDTWCAFGAGPGPRARVGSYDISVRLDGKDLKEERVEMVLEPRAEAVRLLDFELDPRMEVLGVEDAAGAPLYFVRRKTERDRWEGGLTVVLPRPLAAGDRVVVRLRGDIVEEGRDGTFGIRVTEAWYPTLGYLERSTYRLSFDTEARYRIYASGRKTADAVAGGRRQTRFEQPVPVALMSFSYGDFPTEELKVEGAPPVTVFGREEGVVLGNQLKNVGADVARSLAWLSGLIGPIPFEQMYVTWIPYGHGQGFPGLLHLGSFTFAGESPGWSEFFRAHEASHQWWGHVVGWKSYRDQWLSEGFAEYYGALYARASTGDQKLFGQILDGWRRDILGQGNLDVSLGLKRFGFSLHLMRHSKGSAAGPISLGYRLRSSEGPIDYNLLVYEKGAWVLHMLRMLLHDYKTGSDQGFDQVMRSFVDRHRGGAASTADFRAAVEKVVGQDLGWFFDQWVDGTIVPTYRWAWRAETREGKPYAIVRVRQKTPGDAPFRMLVPVRLDLGKAGSAVVRLPVDRPERVFELPAPAPVVGVELNPLDAVLCEVVAEKM